MSLYVDLLNLLDPAHISPSDSFALEELAGCSTDSLGKRLVEANDFESSRTIEATRVLSSVAVLGLLVFNFIGSGLDEEEGLPSSNAEPEAFPCDLDPSLCVSALVLLVSGLAKKPLALLPLVAPKRDSEGLPSPPAGESKLELVVMRA